MDIQRITEVLLRQDPQLEGSSTSAAAEPMEEDVDTSSYSFGDARASKDQAGSTASGAWSQI